MPARAHLGPVRGIDLVVVNRDDWRKLFSYPYGWPFTRTRPQGVSIVVAADYPPKLLHRWDDVLVRAAKRGVRAPGAVHEFLDLLVGHEWGHAACNRTGLRSRVKWLDELLATYLYLAALRSAGEEDRTEQLVAWARVQVEGSAPQRADLGAFEYPRGRLRFDDLLWFQGVLTLRAVALVEARGWDFAEALQGRVEAGRGEVARLLIEVEPSFKAWFTTFAAPAAERSGSAP